MKIKRSMSGALRASVSDEAAAFQERTAPVAAGLQDRFARAEAATGEIVPTPASERPAPPLVVRDTFSFPEGDHARIDATQKRALGLAMAVSKSEVVRAGLVALAAMDDKQLGDILAGLEKVPTGRPGKAKV